ncbi:vitamin B12 transporter [Nitratiruptor sp. YY08-26]|uniref:TonB-dependent receptor plug domain-containing protein n=1 Tax=unclassified Nitratiruptor TaxID=2624044 RepID=UPI001914E710|nr:MULTISPECIES: TonB-dependent receptor [unclassified Nitratiruptor]BCD61806.1 vitamin B12 transporter [Nitratiruptor sp. YY08-13]BCD65741.1 vitamin B12 transporter [Nitratiruptor sp. YY08-26]
MAKGFKRKYFSLAAIAATVSTVVLQAEASQIAQIQKVIVSADKSSEAIEDVSDDIEVIDAQEIEELGIESLKDLLQYAVGVTQSSNGGLGKANAIYLRGLANDKVLILIDGVRFNDPSNISGPSSEHLLLQNIERVEIIKGAQSGIWGADAAAGVINIITKTKAQKSIDIMGGSFRTTKAAFYLADALTNKLSYSLDMNYYKTDGFSAITPYRKNPKDYESDGYINRNVRFKVEYNDESFSLDTGGFYINAYNEADGYNPKSFAPDPNSRNNDKFKYYAIFLNGSKDLQKHHFSFHLDSTTTQRYFLDTSWGVNYFEGKTSTVEVRDTFRYDNGKLQLGGGTQRYKSDYSDTGAKSGSIDYDDSYVYFTNFNRFGSLILQENVRYDAYDKFDNQVTGKIGAKYALGGVSLFANIAKAYNIPNQIKMINPWGKANFNLQPEKSRSYDIGIEAYGAKLVYFVEHVKNLISWFDPDYNSYGDEYYKNFSGTSKFKGVEASYRQAVGEDIFAQIGFTYLQPKDSQGNYLPRRAKTRYSYALSWYPTAKHTININGYYVGKRYDDATKSKKTGNYNVTNLSLSHQFAKNYRGYVRVQNIFNRRYQEVYGYAAQPRSFYIGIEGSF